MRLSAALICGLVLVSACGTDPAGPAPSQPPASSTPPPPPPTLIPTLSGLPLTLGDEVVGGFNEHGQSRYYEVTAPTGGTLVVEVTWDRREGSIVVWIGQRAFGPDESGGRIRVTWTATPDVKYLIRVADSNPWDYNDLRLDYKIKAWLE